MIIGIQTLVYKVCITTTLGSNQCCIGIWGVVWVYGISINMGIEEPTSWVGLEVIPAYTNTNTKCVPSIYEEKINLKSNTHIGLVYAFKKY